MFIALLRTSVLTFIGLFMFSYGEITQLLVAQLWVFIYITVLVNVLIWDAHASSAGIASLVVCVGGGAFYQQAPLRNKDQELRTFEYSRVKDKASEAEAEDAENADEERPRRPAA